MSSVAYGHEDVIPDLNRVVAIQAYAALTNVAGFDNQLAALGHGIASIDCKVHKNLLHLSGINFDRPQIGGRNEMELNIFADQANQHLIEVRYDPVQVQHLCLQNLPTLNASNWRVKAVARSLARSTSSMRGRKGSLASISSAMTSTCPRITVNILLKSCAM